MFKQIATMMSVAALAVGATAAFAADISGAGATFPAPIYARWAADYQRASGDRVNYQAVGSGAGIRQIQARTVVFGASDNPMRSDELARNGLVQFPMVIGGVTPVVNLPGVQSGQLRLNGPILADIYRGIITRWNSPIIASFNPGMTLPNLPITVVHRSDGSGTSFLFTSYLSMRAPRWRASVGAGNSVSWPVGVGGRGNDGVAAMVRQTPGSIGYVEYAYALQNRMTVTQLQNRAGQWVRPDDSAFAAAAAGARWNAAQGFGTLLLDQPGPASWPITGATFILMYRRPADPAASAAALRFFDWALRNGDGAATQLNYVPLPAALKAQIRSSWTAIVGSDGRPVMAPAGR
jgi:phosphate transport system substrate-binding protein